MTKKEFEIQLALGSLSLDDRLESTYYDGEEPSKRIKKTLTILSKDEDSDVRTNIANNPNTPPNVLRTLSKDKSGEVKSSIANNPNTSKEVLTILSKDEDSNVRFLVAYNPNTPKEVLEVLSKDKSGTEIALGATKNLNKRKA